MLKKGGAVLATIKDVAKKAKVSVATVSRVLNDDDVVAAATKKKVLKVIESLDYTPNLLGRNLRRLETKKILVLLNTISNQFYSRIVRGIEECARNEHYSVMICATRGDVEIEKSYLDLLRTKLCDGAIFLSAEADGETLSRELSSFPVVQACEPKEGFVTPTVSISNETAAYEAVCYLIKKGHSEIAFLGGNIYQSSVDRENGFRRALGEAKIPVNEELIINEGFSVNSGIRGAKALLKGKLPTAVFCVSDSCAAGVIKELTSCGIEVPKDISVMGFDDTQISQVFIPSITTTRQPQYEIGYQAMSLLLEKISNIQSENRRIILKHEIVERESVADI